LRDFADYIVLNVSSPNTPGLRALQEEAALSQLLQAICRENEKSRKPILLKIAPDLSLPELDQIVATCEQNEIDGFVATNTMLDHSAIPREKDQSGGLSGAPLREKSTAFVRALRERSSLPIIAVGGIFDAASAAEKFAAGAQLIQVYTGFIYRGPAMLKSILDEF
ncbi:MAG: dihydroorotate dehydrogenase (quinone), partial [Pyrinomonadaceae bacterium]|nr:dihydroorotate dehydrogenase (quinone) [Pyrinomonadaceae bacterium]